jgi:ribosomal protein S18 acetylase RimI-like enzyme
MAAKPAMSNQYQYSYDMLPTGAERAAADLVEKIFLLQVAPHFSKQGVSEFLSYVSPQAISKRLAEKNFMLAAFGAQDLAGILEADSERGHIVWFFVRPGDQGHGVGRKLLDRAMAELKRRKPDLARVTVNSSPNSVDTYLSLGFIPTDLQQEHNGIRFTPMELLFG